MTMARQRGFLWMDGLVVLGILAALAGFGWFVDAHWETSAGVAKGKRDAEAVYAKRDNLALQQAIADKKVAEERVAVLEAEAAARITAADAAYQEGLKDGKTDLKAAVDAVHRGYRLRDPGGSAGTAPKPGGEVAAARDPGQRDGQARTELPAPTGCTLSERTSEALYQLASDADDTAKQLAACQVVARSLYDFALKLSTTLSGGPDGRTADQ